MLNKENITQEKGMQLIFFLEIKLQKENFESLERPS